MRKFQNLLIFIFVLSVQISFGQIVPRDSSYFSQSFFQNNQLNNFFNKQLNTYYLNTNFTYHTRNNKLFWGIRESFSSTINKTSVKNIKDEQSLLFLTDYGVSQFFRPGIILKHSIYSDNRNININQASYLNAILYLKLSPFNKVQLIPYLGYSDNKQASEDNKGLIYGMEGSINKLKFNDFTVFFNGKHESEDINPRKNQISLVNFNLENELERGLKNNISVYYSSLRRDFYFEPDSVTASFYNITNNIQTRTESNYYVQERISYFLPSTNFMFDLSGKVSWRDIDKTTRYIYVENFTPNQLDSKINDFRMEFFSSLNYRNDFVFSNFRLVYNEQEEKHIAKRIENISNIYFEERNELEKQLNNKAKQLTISFSGNFILSETDQLSFSIFHRKLVYDTPSENNYDDRDELLTMLQLYYLKRLSPFFDAFISLEGNLNKIVYIFSERSANNNVKRILKLSSGGIYTGKNLVSANSAEVLANYVVYDFENINPTYKSYSFRQFQFKDSTGLKLNRNTELVVNGYLKLSEQGDFNISSFSGKPFRFLTEIFSESKLYYSIGGLKFGVGVRYFELSTYLYSSLKDKYLDTKYSSIAPLSEISHHITNRLNLKVNCWYEFIRNEKNKRRNQTYFYVDLRWQF